MMNVEAISEPDGGWTIFIDGHVVGWLWKNYGHKFAPKPGARTLDADELRAIADKVDSVRGAK